MLRIRSYRNADYPAVRRILKEAGMFHPKKDSRTVLTRKIKRSPGSILVAERDGAVIGNIYLIFDEWMGLIFRLAVEKTERRHGIGSLLLRRAESLMRQKKVPMISLNVREGEWKRLSGFYLKRGYKPWKHRLYSLIKDL